MSYDKTDGINRRSSAVAEGMAEIDDLKRYRFLQRLDEATFEVTDWEAGFIESQLQRVSTRSGDAGEFTKIIFSPKQRDAIDEMRKKYGGRL